jgi:hypothetical protein
MSMIPWCSQRATIRQVVFLLGFLAMHVRIASAVNIAFMPDDSFFHSYVTETWVNTLSDDDEHFELKYVYPPDSFSFCGYAGFDKLRIEGDTSELKAGMRRVYAALQKLLGQELHVNWSSEGVREVTERSRITILVYNRDADWTRQRPAIKYNENWHDIPETAIRGNTREGYMGIVAAEYKPFVKSPEAIAHDWKYASTFARLNTAVPDNAGWGSSGPKIESPVRARAEDVQLLIVPATDSLEPYFQHDVDRWMLSVAQDGVKLITWGKKGAIVTDWNGEEGWLQRLAAEGDADETEAEE